MVKMGGKNENKKSAFRKAWGVEFQDGVYRISSMDSMAFAKSGKFSKI